MTIAIGILIALLIYGGVLALISKFGAKKTANSSEGYFVGGRDVSTLVLLGSLLMTIWTAGSAYGFPGAAYRGGVGQMSAATGTMFMCFMSPCLMYPLWLLGKRYGWTTPVSIITHRYNSRPLTLFFAFVCIFFSLPVIAAQIIAVSNGADVVTSKVFPYALIVVIMLVFIFGHVIGGGTNNVVAADLFAFFVGMGIFILYVYFLMTNLINPMGGLAEATRRMQETTPDLLRHTGGYGTWYSSMGLTLTAGAGVILWPHVLQRSFMARSTHAFKVQAVAMPPIILLMFGMYLFIGVWPGHAAFGSLSVVETDSIVSMLAMKYTPVALCSLMVVAIFSFALSTADSQVIAVSSTIESDIYQEKSRKVNMKRINIWLAVLMVGVLLVVAFRPALVVNYAWMFASPCFVQMGPAIFGGMFWKKATKEGAAAGTFVGIIVVLIALFFYNPLPTLNPIGWGLLFNIPVFIIVSLSTKPYEKGSEEVPGWLSHVFKERNNAEFKVLCILTAAVFMQDNFTAYMPNPILFGWLPLHWFNHWLVAFECSVLGYFFCRNRFGERADAKNAMEEIYRNLPEEYFSRV